MEMLARAREGYSSRTKCTKCTIAVSEYIYTIGLQLEEEEEEEEEEIY